MINIRPVSDLRNKYPEIEKIVLENNEPVYLTKNGYGSMVVMSLEKYSQLMTEKEYNEYVRIALKKSEEELDDPNISHLTHEEVMAKARRIINGND